MGIRLDEKKKRKQEALLESAFQLFTLQGINNTSISEIAKKAKMAKGTFYLYFKDKYDIRDRLIAHKASQVFEKAHTALQSSGIHTLEDRVVFFADNIIDQLNENKSLLRFVAKNLSWAIFSNIRIPSMEATTATEMFQYLIGVQDRKFRDQELMLYMIVEIVNSTCYNVILESSPCTLEELKPELNRTICGMLHQFEIIE